MGLFLLSITITGMAGLLLAVLMRGIVRLRRAVEKAEVLVGHCHSGTLIVRAERVVTALIQTASLAEPRLPTHTVSGLPTREPLIHRIRADRAGTIGVLAFKDYDRLCAFDPELADRFLIAMVERMATMMPADRILAHLDRAHVAVWLGSDVEASSATVEIRALAYALSDCYRDDEREIIPEIAFRINRFDIALHTPEAFLSQTLSSFASVPRGANENIVSDDHKVRSEEQFQIGQDLRQVVAKDQLHMRFQPLIDAASARVCGAEALLRWRHPERGDISPACFIPVMETVGLSQEIGSWALNRALRETRLWRENGHDLRIAVNVSGHQIEAANLPQLIERTLARNDVDGEALEIELTESVALAKGDGAAAFSQALRANGIRLAIDDFGTGYSSFEALTAIGFDKIKIDRTFVTNVHLSRQSQAICASILTLGRGLGINVLAEGVETIEEFIWLRDHGCRLFQGFYFSPPLTSQRFLDFVKNREGLLNLLQLSDQSSYERTYA
ncbi:EAL domain-containing protein [Altererythrobacter aurantiacus]|uniref:EAL domain-containing protein n=1 Tax=Parapontixanthobacter aurantiacus TaxID=1463599 RepID=A0A844ZFS3_9SPHN|nr:EAL domain-containing protein [Parapontixanthobacter aurantiacus]MXO85996.1 EAL domain-containing protein [Parapontixanthobacter aurantiacus]